MRRFFALIAAVCLVLTAASAMAMSVPERSVFHQSRAEFGSELPARVPDGFARTDTLNFGFYQVIGGNKYAVLGGQWTWDHGSVDPLEGWYATDNTANVGDYFKQITAASWAGHGNTVAAPIINGTGSVWIGQFENDANALCWESGLGYGNGWCQRLASPELTYTGAGNVHLQLTYFEDSEYNFDYGKVLVLASGNTVQVNGPGGFTGQIGTPPTGPWASYSRDVTADELGGEGDARPFQIVFEFQSDGGWSDQDGYYTTSYGPFGVDDFAISGSVLSPVSYTWDSDLQGWTKDRCAGLGSYMAVHPISLYSSISFPCACQLSGNVLAFHNESYHHVMAGDEGGWSPPADRTSWQAYNKILAEWDQYSDLPQANGVHYRPGWSYYPYLCPSTGQYMWSGRKGQDSYFYDGETPICYQNRNVGTDWGVPTDCQLVGFVYEVFTSCDAFGIPPTQCTGASNASPIIDNVRIRMTGTVNAPSVTFDTGDSYQDGFPMGEVLNVMGVGNANVGRQLNLPPNANNDPWRLGDSLVVVGPAPTTSTRWESKLWFRVKREGPGQMNIATYRDWKYRVADGRNIAGANGQFTFGWMDSVETASVSRVKFDSYFRENDDDYSPGPAPRPDIAESNEIIKDGMLTPGTKIEYFITSNFICLPTTYFYYPDTTGKAFWEFEILPSYRTDPATGGYKYPCVLYVNAATTARRTFMERSLNVALNGASPSTSWMVPDPTRWDRYDYQNPSSNFHAPMIRNTNGNNGATVAQLLGYRIILMSLGINPPSGTMDYRDYQGFDDWLTLASCGGNERQQGFWGSGDDLCANINMQLPSFLNDRLGATWTCDKYWQAECPPGKAADENYCVRLEPIVGGAWTPSVQMDLYGNWCPQQYATDVINTIGSGVANKAFRRIGGELAHEAQVVNDQMGANEKYRSVIDGYYISHAIQRSGSDPNLECVYDSSRVISATYDEVSNILKWTLNTADPLSLGLCIDPCLDITTAPDAPLEGKVNRLSQNQPNPFNPSTAIHYSLAQSGPAALVIFDVNGRRVKTLVNGQMAAGPHVQVWDGLDEAGHKVPAGIYWSQLTTGSYTSNKKMVVVR